MDIRPQLRATSDALLVALDELRELEGQKRKLGPGTPEFAELAKQIETLAEELLRNSETEERLAQRSVELVEDGRGDVAAQPIEAMAAPRDVHLILGEWRDAERRLAAETPGSQAWEQATVDAERLRAEYRRAHEDALRSASEDAP
jgi:hypothetical protein